MKRQLIERQTESTVMTLDELRGQPDSMSFYYGVQVATRRGFISRQDYGRGEYRVFSPDALTCGNHWDRYNSIDLMTLLSRVLTDKVGVFVFDTAQELFKWLSEP